MYTTGSCEVVTPVNHIGGGICLEHLHALITILITGASVWIGLSQEKGIWSNDTTWRRNCLKYCDIAAFRIKIYLYNRGDHSGGQALALCCGGHVGDGAEVVHLAHGHGDRGWGQADWDQGVWHHHEGEFQAWNTWRGRWLLNDAYYEWDSHRGNFCGPGCKLKTCCC